MTDPSPSVPSTVYVVLDHRTRQDPDGGDPELTVHASEQAAYAAIGLAAVAGSGMRPGEVTVQVLPVQGYQPETTGPFTPYPIKRPTWIPSSVLLEADDEEIRLNTGQLVASIAIHGWTEIRDYEFARYIVDLVNADLAASWAGGQR